VTAKRIAVEYGIDAFHAVTVDDRLGENFVKIRFPQIVSELAKLRG
jgi:hypothetical protein